jgi:uncharacterized protein (TIGR00369 family)
MTVSTAPSVRRDPASGFDRLDAIRRGELPAAPITALLGMTFDELDEGRTVFSIVPRPEHENPMGTMHGGVLATLVDSAMGCAVLSMLRPGTSFTTLELKTNYVRAVTTRTGRLRAEGLVVHLGGRVATTEARVTDDDGRLYAHATSTCLLITPEVRDGGTH